MNTDKYKIILVGDSNVGKTSIMNNYCKKELETKTTIGTEYSRVLINNLNQELQIWDCAGQEKFRSLTKLYYRNSHICLLIFDLNNVESLYNINNYWKKNVEDNVENCMYFLIGNKSDLEKYTDYNIINELCKLYKMDYIECSAKESININLIFNKVSSLLYANNILNKNVIKDKNNIDLREKNNIRYNLYSYC